MGCKKFGRIEPNSKIGSILTVFQSSLIWYDIVKLIKLYSDCFIYLLLHNPDIMPRTVRLFPILLEGHSIANNLSEYVKWFFDFFLLTTLFIYSNLYPFNWNISTTYDFLYYIFAESNNWTIKNLNYTRSYNFNWFGLFRCLLLIWLWIFFLKVQSYEYINNARKILF